MKEQKQNKNLNEKKTLTSTWWQTINCAKELCIHFVYFPIDYSPTDTCYFFISLICLKKKIFFIEEYRDQN